MRYNTAISGVRSGIAEQTYSILADGTGRKSSKCEFSPLLDEKRITILLELQKKGFLTISHIWRLCYRDKKRPAAEAGVRALLQRGMVDRHRYFMGRGIGYLESFYFITRKGFNYLKNCELPEFIEGGFRYKDAPMTIANYAHRKATLDFWISLENSLPADSSLDLVAFVPEWQPDDRGERIIMTVPQSEQGRRLSLMPDATFIVRSNRATSEGRLQESLFFVEIDMDTEAITGKRSLIDRFLKYQLAFSGLSFRHLGSYYERFSGARLLFVANSTDRAARVAETIVVNPALSNAFLFTSLDEMVREGIFKGSFILSGKSSAVDINGQKISHQNK